VVKAVGGLFFDRKYLDAPWVYTREGWRWVWRGIVWQKVFGFNRGLRFPASPFIRVSNGRNLEFDPADVRNFQSMGVYLQNFSARIVIGRGTYIAPNVGLITANHDLDDLDHHTPGEDIVLGERCWIGMGAVVMPGVRLGPRTIVAANAVVTKSFPEGNCIVGGVPAKVLRELAPGETPKPEAG
jgi:acetyltransferase-like isoleucine patch superfamily enzyme